MNKILNKTKLIMFLENFKISRNDRVWFHHPITDDLTQGVIKDLKKDSVTITMPEDSQYYGQPDFSLRKTKIIGTL